MITPSSPASQGDETAARLGAERPADPSHEIDAQLHLAQLRQRYAGAEAEPILFREWYIERKLGRGGMGVVYLARHRTLGRRVALKLLTATDPRRDLVREARALAASPDPNVVQVYSVDDATPVIIEMEYVDGYDLRAWRAEQAPDWRTLTTAYTAVASGLAAIHRAGLIHRDIKPDNILTTRDGALIKIADFGLAVAPSEPVGQAQAAPSSPLAVRCTAEGALVGTHGYIAPEVLAGRPATPLSDQFSFASAFFEALFGELPFQASTPEEQAAALHRGTLALPAAHRIPSWLVRVLQRALAFEPARRHPSMETIVEQLRRGLARRRWWMIGVSAFVTVSAVATASWALKPTPTDPCAHAGAPMRALWPANVRDALTDATRAAQPPRDRARDHLLTTIDRRATAWIEADVRLCAAQQSAPLFDPLTVDLHRRQRACLDHTKRDLQALLVGLTAAPTPPPAQQLWDAAAELEAIPTCDDLRAIAAWPTNTPRDDDALDQLTKIAALERAARHPEAEQAARALALRPDLLPYRRVQALYRLGHILSEQHRYLPAASALDESRDLAWISGQDALACKAAVHQAKLAALVAFDPRSSRRELHFTEGCVQRARANTPLLHADLLEARGLHAFAAGDLIDARGWHRRSLELRRELLGADHLDVTRSLHNLANALVDHDLNDHEAARHFAEALALRERLLGTDHPSVADILFDQAKIQTPPEARVTLARALAIFERASGAHQAARARIHLDLGILDLSEHHLSRAEEHLERVRSLQAAAIDLPTDHIDRIQLIHYEGALAFLNNDFHRARALLTRAISLYRRRDPDSAEALAVLPQWIEAAAFQRDSAAIAAEARAAGAPLQRDLAALPPVETGKLAWYIAEALQSDGSSPEALPYLHLAIAAYRELGDPRSVAELQWLLAQALSGASADPDEARAAADAALRFYRDRGARREVATISRWLAQQTKGPRSTTATTTP
jgi:serine/threonine protein kinase